MASGIRNNTEIPGSDSETTTDTLLLACSLAVPPGSLVVEMGCGSGGAMIAASRMNPGCRWIGFDLRLAPLNGINARASGQSSLPQMFIMQADASAPPIKSGKADAVMCNPPFAKDRERRRSPDPSRELCRSAPPMAIHRFIRTGADLLREGGTLVMINRPSVLPEMLLGFRASGLCAEIIQPVGMPACDARHIILTGRKGGRAAFRLSAQRTPESILQRFHDAVPGEE